MDKRQIWRDGGINLAVVKNLMVRCGADFSALTTATATAKSSISTMQKSVSASTGKMTSSISILKSAMASLGIVFSAYAVLQFGKSCLNAASDLQEVQNVVDVTFGSMSDQVNNFSKNAIDSFGLSEYSAKHYASTLGAMLKSSGISGQTMTDMSISLTELSADMASFYNLKPDEAFEKIQSGLAGTVRPLRDLGVNMTVANLQSYALSQGITKSYDSMSQAEQVMLRYGYLLSVTGDAQGDFARTSNSWANQTKVLSMRFEELKTQIGQGLINALTPALRMLNGIVSALTTVAAYWNALTVAIFGKQAAVASKSADSATDAADAENGYADAVKAAGKAAKSNLASFDKLNVLQQDTSSGSGSSASNPSIAGINALSGDLGQNITFTIPKGLTDFIDKVKELVSKNIDLGRLKDAFDRLKTSVTELSQSPIGKFIGSIVQEVALVFLERLAQNVKLVIDYLVNCEDIMTLFWTLLSGDFSGAADQAKTLLHDLGQTIEDTFVLFLGQDAVDAIKTFVSEWATRISAWWTNDVAPWFSADKWSELWTNVKTAFATKWEEIVTWWQESGMYKWWENHVKPFFTKEKWVSIMGGVKTAFSQIFRDAINGAIGLLNTLIAWVNEKLHFDFEGLTIKGKEIIPAFSFQLFSLPPIQPLATGGIADSATMAMIGEAGKEAVLPLENNTGWMDELAKRIGGDVVIQASGGANLMKYLNIQIAKEGTRRGTSLVKGGAY